MRLLALLSLVAAGCFNPTFTNTHCGEGNSCPSGYECVATLCVPRGAPTDGAPPPTDGPPTDGAPPPPTHCTPMAGGRVSAPFWAMTGDIEPVLVTAPRGDPRVFVVGRKGTIVVYDRNGLNPHTFVDLSSRITFGGTEQGLLGLAFAPDYATSGLFYVDYTRAGATGDAGDTIIAELKVSSMDPNAADPMSHRVVMLIDQPFANHNGGMLEFGPDGYLYIGMGDGGSGNDPMGNGQSLSVLLGKLLRIDPRMAGVMPYTIPPTNPFVMMTGAKKEIWAYGLRNPWRFSFDARNGDLYIADVGQNAKEEIDVQPGTSHGGENYGWSIMEGDGCLGGSTCNPALYKGPLVVHPHTDDDADGNAYCSIIGGAVYRGACFPDLDGRYFYTDYCEPDLMSFLTTDLAMPTQAVSNPGTNLTSVHADGLGELYITSQNGVIYRIQGGPEQPLRGHISSPP